MEKELNEEYLNRIMVKLHNGIRLEESEIQVISVAIRKANNITHEPFYEVVYHDEYDRTEHRIMNPVGSGAVDHGDYIIQCDKFEVDFNRCIPKRSEQIIQNESQAKSIKSEEDVFVGFLKNQVRAKMPLYEILELIDHDFVIAVKIEKEIELKTVWGHLGVYGGDENIHCKEIDLLGYTAPTGISYLLLHAYDIRNKVQQDDELPFPLEELPKPYKAIRGESEFIEPAENPDLPFG